MSASAADFLPPKRNLTALRRAAEGCRGCVLWKDATQTVFGEGRARAELMLVGVTVHPSAILRVRERDERQDALAGLVEDLEAVSAALADLGTAS